METKAYGDRCGNGPCCDIPDTNRGHYQIQQNIYAAILAEYYNVHVGKMTLLQLHPSQDDYVEHDVPFERDVVEAIFATRHTECAGKVK